MHKADGDGYDRYIAELETVVPLIKKWILRAPPEVGRGRRAGCRRCSASGATWSGCRPTEIRIVHDFATRSAGDILDRHFKGDLAKALFGFDGVVGNFASPYTPGTAYVLLHHLFGEAAGVPGAWGHAIGGMGSITQAMARAAPRGGRRHRPQHAGRGADRRARPRGRRRRRRQGVAREASWSPGSTRSCCSTGWCPPGAVEPDVAARMHALEVRKRDLPDERRSVRAAEVHRAAEEGRPPDRRHHHRAEPRLYGPRLSRRAA